MYKLTITELKLG